MCAFALHEEEERAQIGVHDGHCRPARPGNQRLEGSMALNGAEAGISTFFAGKPATYEIFRVVADRIEALGPTHVEVKSQISYSVERKFAWFWLYNVTKKNPNGILHVMLAIDHHVDEPGVREVNQVSTSRWNHQVVIRTLDDARSEWLGDLLVLAYEYGRR